MRSLYVATLGVNFSQVGPGVFLLDGVAPLYAPQKMNTSPSSRVVRACAARFLKLNLARKKKSRTSQVYQSTSTQVVTEFRGPLNKFELRK